MSARTHRGLGRAFQLTQLFPNLSVLENVRLAVQSRRHEGLSLFAVWLDRKETLARARALVERVRLGDRADAAASSLPHGDQRKLEVAMLMALEPSVYMFDEPTAGMSVDDVPVILDLIRRLKGDADKTILLVEHKMDVVRELADRIIVLHNGQLVADGEPAAVIASPIVQQAYLGLAPEAARGRAVRLQPGSGRAPCDRCSARRRAHAHRRVPHPARRRLRGAGGRGDDAARPQRRRQDDDAAHDHGPVGGVARAGRLRRPADRRAGGDAGGAAPAQLLHAGDRRAGHRLRAREHGHLRRPQRRREHAARGALGAHASTSSTAARLEWLFGLFPALKKFWLHPAGKLSGGQKQMLAIARAMVEPRRLLLIDEPSKGLAPAIVQNLIAALRELKRTETTVLLVEQNFAGRAGARRPRRGDGRRPRRPPRRDGRARRRRGAAAPPARPLARRAPVTRDVATTTP